MRRPLEVWQAHLIKRQYGPILMDWGAGTGYYQCLACGGRLVFHSIRSLTFAVVIEVMRLHLESAHNVGLEDLHRWAEISELPPERLV